MKDLFFQHGPNLALYKQIGEHKDFWSDHWQSSSIEQVHAKALSGSLDELENPLLQYLPRHGLILEAGCGTGKFVWALQSRGFSVEGVDYSDETIKRILAVDPAAKVRIGDIYHIDRPDGYYSGYLSIGVLEHNYDGPKEGLAEAYRILQPGGIACITVPLLNSPRKRKRRRLSEATAPLLNDGFRFYQDYVDEHEFSRLMESVGFTILTQYPHLLFGGLIRDFSWGRWLNSHGFFFHRLRNLVVRFCARAPLFLRRRYAHMMLFVAQK